MHLWIFTAFLNGLLRTPYGTPFSKPTVYLLYVPSIRRGDCAINAVYAVYYPSYVRSILHPAVATSSDALPTCLSKLILVHMKLLLSYLFRTY